MKTVFIFYENELVFEIENEELYALSRSMCVENPDFYNKAYVYEKNPPPKLVLGAAVPIPYQKPSWFRLDGTPVLLINVPKKLLALLLIT